MTLTISGKVLSARPTKEGKRLRVVIAGESRVNDLVMLPAGAKVAQGDELPPTRVRAAVETTRDGRPMRSIVYWSDGDAG